MRSCFICFLALVAAMEAIAAESNTTMTNAPRAYVIPVREDVMPPLTYLIRRGIKEAMEASADVLILDMETNGGRVDVTEEIITILGRFPGPTATFVNRKAFSAGAFIAVATRHIFMAPQSVIGAAAPILMMPGAGVEKLPETFEAKMTSGIKALVRTTAKKNGHNPDVVEAMIDRTKELTIDGEILNKEGQILTLDNEQAEKNYGDPAKPLLSAGTVATVEELLDRLGYSGASIHRVAPMGAERIASWINSISPILLIIGIAGLYLEFKTPGFGLPGMLGISAFVLYFFGGYVAGLAGLEWLALFVLGVLLVILELFVFPGMLVLGFLGAVLMIISLLMGMADVYPGTPSLPSLPDVSLPVADLLIGLLGAAVLIYLLNRWLPSTHYYGQLVSNSASGSKSLSTQLLDHEVALGRSGIALSVLRPGGKAQFGDEVRDVMTAGEFLSKGTPVKIVGFNGCDALVEPLSQPAASLPPRAPV